MYNATLMCDASYHSETKAGGYGWCVSSCRGKKGGGGFFTTNPECNTIAEMMAVVNALFKAMKARLIVANDNILIQIDAVAAIDAFTGKRILRKDQEKLVFNKFIEMREKYNLNVTFKHVRAHTKVKDKRTETNQICDAKAKHYMKIRRNFLLAKSEPV